MSATGRGAERSPADYYPTPAWCVRRLLERVRLPGGYWLEPSAGDGAIIRAVNAFRGDLSWLAVELRQECTDALVEAQLSGLRPATADAHTLIADFLSVPNPRRFDVAILNPPFTLALPFVERCLGLADWVVVLLRLNWLEGAERHRFLCDHAPDVYVLPNRPSFTGEGTDATAYAWMVWPKGEHNRSAGRLEILSLTSAVERGENPAQGKLILEAPPTPMQIALFGPLP